ncbi:MAG: hypothetical protein ACRCUP_07480 [Mycoplasmatales bacterium]
MLPLKKTRIFAFIVDSFLITIIFDLMYQQFNFASVIINDSFSYSSENLMQLLSVINSQNRVDLIAYYALQMAVVIVYFYIFDGVGKIIFKLQVTDFEGRIRFSVGKLFRHPYVIITVVNSLVGIGMFMSNLDIIYTMIICSFITFLLQIGFFVCFMANFDFWNRNRFKVVTYKK